MLSGSGELEDLLGGAGDLNSGGSGSLDGTGTGSQDFDGSGETEIEGTGDGSGDGEGTGDGDGEGTGQGSGDGDGYGLGGLGTGGGLMQPTSTRTTDALFGDDTFKFKTPDLEFSELEKYMRKRYNV